MKGFYKEISNAKYDPEAGIRIAPLQEGTVMDSYGTRMNAGTRVTCHLHTNGDEWYSILEGEGGVYLADLVNGELVNKRHHFVCKGDTFCIPQNTAHQMYALTQLDFIFFCPKSHLGEDRFVQPDF